MLDFAFVLLVDRLHNQLDKHRRLEPRRSKYIS